MKKVIIIAVAIVLAGLMLPVSVSKLKSYDRTVDVKGLCEKEMRADKVIWPLTYKVVGNDLNSALAEIESDNAAIMAFLHNGGISDADITVKAPEISDKYASEYGNNDRVYRFLCTCVITVCTSDVDKVLELQTRLYDLMKGGVALTTNDWQYQTQYKFEALNDIKPAMIEEATANAREAARKFAQDSGSRLGKIKNASQGTFSIEDRDTHTPYIKKVRVVTYVTYYLNR